MKTRTAEDIHAERKQLKMLEGFYATQVHIVVATKIFNEFIKNKDDYPNMMRVRAKALTAVTK